MDGSNRTAVRRAGLGPVVIGCLAVVAGGFGCGDGSSGPDGGSEAASTPLMRVHLFRDPGEVRHFPRVRFVFEHPEALQPLRTDEGLDRVVEGAVGDEALARRLMHWVRDQWEPGRPDPYPPPDARIILDDIRSGRTGGFCAQYCFVLLQAVGSFGVPARCVTVEGHEVIEAWMRDQERWVLFDPLNDLQISDREGRSLNALEIRHLREADPSGLRLMGGERLAESPSRYFARYRNFAVWLRNDFVSQPMNFTDFDRYRVWFDPTGDLPIPAASLKTGFSLDLYP